MGMGPCLPFISWVWFKVLWIELRYKYLGLESRLIELDDGETTIHCWVPKGNDESQEKKPALMFIQGFGMNGTFGWEHQVPAFAKKYRVYVPDLVFFGKSYTTNSQRSEIFQGNCLKKMLDILKVDRVHIVGTSYGGIVGYHMAANYPKLVDKVVVASSGVLMKPTTNDRLLKLAQVNDVKEMLVPKDVKKMKVGLSVATVWRIWLIPTFVLQDIFDWFNRDNVQEREELVDSMITGSKGAPPVPVISQSVLILWGTQDRIFHPDLAEQLKKYLGDKANLIYIQRAGHVPQVEHPRQYNAHILKFLSS